MNRKNIQKLKDQPETSAVGSKDMMKKKYLFNQYQKINILMIAKNIKELLAVLEVV